MENDVDRWDANYDSMQHTKSDNRSDSTDGIADTYK
jgi:hypothetical protein